MGKKRKSQGLNKIILSGGIDDEAFKEFSAQLTEFEIAGVRDVQIELNSPGGHAMDALAFYGRMRTSPTIFTVTGYGLIASAAVLVLAAGSRRLMTREAWVMVHEDSVHKYSGKTTDMVAFARQMRRNEEQWNKLLEEATGTSAEQWDYLHLNETFLTAEECLRYNLVQEVI